MDDQIKMDEQLKHLFEYTKFHVGMYTTLIAAIVALFAGDVMKNSAYITMIPFLGVSVVFFLFAGMCGGLVASSIPFFTSFQEFKAAKLLPWSTRTDLQKGIPSMRCAHWEHFFFWCGCLAAVVGLIISLRVAVPCTS